MPALERQDAIETLMRAVPGMGPDDLLDFHNELFPEAPESELDPKDGVAAVRKKVTDYYPGTEEAHTNPTRQRGL